MARRWKTLDDVDLSGKRVLTRVDFNVPLRRGRIADNTRIVRALPTIKTIRAQNGLPVLMSHLGRPEPGSDRRLSLAVLAADIERACGARVLFCPATVGPRAAAAVARAGPGDIVLLENLRFDPGETANDQSFAEGLAALGDVYCNDAFSASHRAHASIDRVARLLPCCAGRLMAAELDALESALGNPKRPLAALVGGAKISTKIELLVNLLNKTDCLIVGGAMANTFLLAQGYPVGRSLAEPDMAATARKVIAHARSSGCDLVLPCDSVVAPALDPGAAHSVAAVDGCPDDRMILDVGPQTVTRISGIFARSGTLIWNGPLGAFEVPPFDTATVELAQTAAKLTKNRQLLSYAGGGDTTAALNHAGAADQFTYVSAAGGAFLEWMEGRQLPGIVALAEESR